MTRKLKVFLCHASEDKPAVQGLYERLVSESWIEPWLDKENLLPGQDWNLEINKATREADVIIICMSKISVEKEGYLNKEIRRVLDISNEKLEGAIYIIPLRLDDCQPSFERLKKIHYADYFTPNAHERLLKSLRLRADALKVEIIENRVESVVEEKSYASTDDDLDLYRFIEIQPSENSKVSYPFWIGKFPVTNVQYERFLNALDYANPVYWLEFSKFDKNCKMIGDWGRRGLNWLQDELKRAKSGVLLPHYWNDKSFGKANPNNPVVAISWYEASAYCEWLFQNWNALSEGEVHLSLKPKAIRLPLGDEWITAAGGDKPEGRYPWDEVGTRTTSLKEILRRSNLENGIGRTTPVDAYALGKSPYGVMDMAGNVWEWQANYYGDAYLGQETLALRGGSWLDDKDDAHVAFRESSFPHYRFNKFGFRVAIIPKD